MFLFQNKRAMRNEDSKVKYARPFCICVRTVNVLPGSVWKESLQSDFQGSSILNDFYS